MRAAGWDGGDYDAVSRPQVDAGARIIDRLDVRPGSVIIDVGCGSGRVTELILDRYPTVSVIALDKSTSMLATAEKRLSRHAERLNLIRADLAEPWRLQGSADAVVSTNTFHWVLDHEHLFASVFEALKPGGQLVAVFGGGGSLQTIRDAASRAGVLVDGINNYATAEATARRLEDAGFADVRCLLEPELVRFPTPGALAEYLAKAALAPHEHGASLAAEVSDALAEPVADFVRLYIEARRPT